MKFGPFSFDAEAGALSRGGAPVALGHRAIELLRLLLGRRGEAVGKQELMDAAWPGQAVEESNLTVQIAALRKALGTTTEGRDWIATVPRVGYRFLAESAEGPAPAGGRPSIAVLPFENISSDPEQSFFAAGLSEDLITDLSKVAGLIVIARNSSFAMADRKGDIRGIARELGARFIVEGSVRRAADRVRINAQLIEAADMTHVWADRFDGDLADVFALQDQVVRQIVTALAGIVPTGAVPKRRRAPSLEAYDFLARGRILVLTSPEGHRLGHPLLRRATELDPDFAEAHAWLAMSYVHSWLNWGEPQSQNQPLALSSARRAVELDSENADAHAMLGYVMGFERQLAAGLRELETALLLNPNHADALCLRSEILVHMGRSDEGVQSALAAFRLNPHPPAWYYWILGFAQYGAGRYEDVVATLENGATRRTGSQRILAAALAQLGRMDEAREAAREYLETVPHFTIRDWSMGQPLEGADERSRFLEGYRKAGLPE